MGPTASGKTALALRLAERFRVELISVDSALVYRGMDIGTAKPDTATLARYPHRLVDIRDPRDAYSAAEFRADALHEMAAISASGNVPLLVGGTGLYFRSLQYGLSDLPEANTELRERLSAEARTLGWTALHARLAELDPAAAQRIRTGDTQRIQRALEVIALTGRPLSEQQGGARERFPWRVLKLTLMPADRALLHARIAERLDLMFAEGFVDEVRGLRARGDLHADLASMRAVGYRQVWQHLDGEFDLVECRERAIHATRQLAKRQITWFRADRDALAIDPFEQRYIAQAERAAADFLLF
ncbi:MAG: tRNA (adenosine(37)-N6)-dimethylallyltransferase MiaA [Rudaea sp.]|uniref:tRNA (adenosine(37)-N6)-dimethylallyltransferase MiaA n=1 Tax=unclassified Rudaea TaxID=2627037 RepID=UPI0010F50743|nr:MULTISPECIES: tRNA (adenosine(37)-N6)-dimethylallyltransferase MiaA [unclassified Rudaea]MBN8888219.1 tRNA (adenosine(37)-N6)-dimethylallyltransferase MiaA [Rudaea sp.]MBR0343631.1 tRNA (adenosine(37)-N6)-dimethylallyltransferase MiaA [Rudaea sp.]